MPGSGSEMHNSLAKRRRGLPKIIFWLFMVGCCLIFANKDNRVIGTPLGYLALCRIDSKGYLLLMRFPGTTSIVENTCNLLIFFCRGTR